MENLDLNIRNYDLEDITNLFQIPINFNKEHLKNAKKIVLKTHPDKSRLDKKYFLFFTKAYKILYSIYEFKYKNEKDFNNEIDTEYEKFIELFDEDQKMKNNGLREKVDKFTNSDNFNKEFNKLFENNRLTNEFEEKGYGNILKQDSKLTQFIQEKEKSGIDTSSLQEQQMILNSYKEDNRNIIKHRGVQEMNGSMYGTSLLNDAPEEYGSDIFSKLAYDDIKKVHHDESIIVINENDTRKEQFSNIDQLQQYRNNQDTTPLSNQQAKNYLSQRQEQQETESTKRAYFLAKQVEKVKEIENNTRQFFYKLKY
jgi:hypothetical protein